MAIDDYAIAVGITSYPDISNLQGPENDAQHFYEWLVAADGGVFTFGNARFYGSAAGYPSFSPCVGMLPTTTGRGYVLLRADGSIWAFGDSQYLGGANGALTSNAVGIAGTLKPR